MDFRQSSGKNSRQSSEKYSANRRKSDVKSLQLSKNRTFDINTSVFEEMLCYFQSFVGGDSDEEK